LAGGWLGSSVAVGGDGVFVAGWLSGGVGCCGVGDGMPTGFSVGLAVVVIVGACVGMDVGAGVGVVLGAWPGGVAFAAVGVLLGDAFAVAMTVAVDVSMIVVGENGVADGTGLAVALGGLLVAVGSSVAVVVGWSIVGAAVDVSVAFVVGAGAVG